jgi:cytochrome c
MKNLNLAVLAGSLFFAMAAISPAQAAPDEAKAKQLILDNKCSKCHSATKTKSGPSWAKVAAKYKGKPEGEKKIIDNITLGPMVKLDDGTKEEHKIIKTKDMAELKNLAQWILAH